jgi:hypothetical protein
MGKRKLIAEMSPEEREIQREKWRTEQAQSREQKKRARHLPTAEEWNEEFSKTPQYKELRQYAEKFSNKVTEEIGHSLTISEGYAVELVAWTSLSLKKNWVRDVWEPYGEHFAGGMYFADAIGSVIVEAAHRGLDKSPTFTGLYKELLPILDNKIWSRQHGGFSRYQGGDRRKIRSPRSATTEAAKAGVQKCRSISGSECC